MGWIPAEQWARLKAGVDCPMCADMHLEVNAFSYLVAEFERSYARLVRNQYRRGWTILALKRHAAELFESAEDEHAEFWREVACMARALNDHDTVGPVGRARRSVGASRCVRQALQSVKAKGFIQAKYHMLR
jgi:hypothetical protein